MATQHQAANTRRGDAPTYRSDQVGSLLRPPELLEARAAYDQGYRSAEELQQAEDRAILAALELQRRIGIDVVSDGEYRRYAYMSDVADAVEGFSPAERTEMPWRGPREGPSRSLAQVVTGKLRQRRRLTLHEASFLAKHAPGPYKVTIPNAQHFSQLSYRQGVSDAFYPTRADLLRELAGIINRELLALASEGVPYLHLDAPIYTFFVDPSLREQIQAQGENPDEAFQEGMAADLASLEGVRRDGLVVGMHLCRGNSRSRWMAEGGYDPIAEQLFNAMPVDRFLLEYDAERAGDFSPLRFMPPDKMVVLGLISTKVALLESADEVVRRVEEAARYVPIERLAIAPQCGFASSLPGNLLTMDDQWRKLELVVEVARRVWG